MVAWGNVWSGRLALVETATTVYAVRVDGRRRRRRRRRQEAEQVVGSDRGCTVKVEDANTIVDTVMVATRP